MNNLRWEQKSTVPNSSELRREQIQNQNNCQHTSSLRKMKKVKPFRIMMTNEVKELECLLTDDDYEIDPLLSMIYVVILESCRDEVNVLNSPYRNASNEKHRVMHIPIERRFGFSEDVILEQNMHIRLASSQSEFSRQDQILTLLQDVLQYGISDLLERRSYIMLYQAVHDIQTMKNEEYDLISEFKINYNLNSKLTDEALTDRMGALDHIKEKDNKIHFIRGEYEEFLQEAAVKYTTLSTWERSRCEQNRYFNKMRKNICKKLIQEKKKAIKDEEIASREMSKFYEEHMKDLRADIMKWMTKYDDDIDAKDLSIMKQRIEVEEMQIQLRDLKQRIFDREKEMTDWVDLRTRRRKERVVNTIREWAAMKIQRWWRNILEERRRRKYRRRAKKRKSINKK